MNVLIFSIDIDNLINTHFFLQKNLPNNNEINLIVGQH